MTTTELIEAVATNGYNIEISHENVPASERGHVLVRVLDRCNFVEGEAVIDLDDENGPTFDEALDNFLCRFW